MDRLQIPASLMLALLAATGAEAAKKPTNTDSGGGRTLADYNIQKESAVQRPTRLRLAPR